MKPKQGALALKAYRKNLREDHKEIRQELNSEDFDLQLFVGLMVKAIYSQLPLQHTAAYYAGIGRHTRRSAKFPKKSHRNL